jgi:hypothetical protein
MPQIALSLQVPCFKKPIEAAELSDNQYPELFIESQQP